MIDTVSLSRVFFGWHPLQISKNLIFIENWIKKERDKISCNLFDFFINIFSLSVLNLGDEIAKQV